MSPGGARHQPARSSKYGLTLAKTIAPGEQIRRGLAGLPARGNDTEDSVAGKAALFTR